MRKGVDWRELFLQREKYGEWLTRNLFFLEGSAILLGDEYNTVHFDWEKAFRSGTLDDHLSIALIECNATKYASCSVAVKLFYQELHEYNPSWIVERLFCPFSDNNVQLMKKEGIRCASAEGHMPAEAFDILCFSQQMIGEEVNLIGMLLDAGIPLDNRERTQSDPIVIRGGASSFNPSLIMDVCDLFFIGEGEDILPELLSLLEEGIRKGRSRKELLLEAVKTWDCLFAPRFYEQRFLPDGTLAGMFPLRPDVPETIRYACVQDLDQCFICTRPVGNYFYPLDISMGVELTKGCEGQCSFCVSGFTSLPFRARSVDRVIEAINEQYRNTGVGNASFSSFCGASYPYLNTLIRKYHEEIPLRMKVLTQRIDSLQTNPEFTGYLAGQGTKRIVFGVEGISQKLRQSVSKNYTEEQILETVRMLCRSSYNVIKFMFVAGLPGETEEDRKELIRLAKKLVEISREEEKNGFPAPAFLFTWTPLMVFPFTPYQWLALSPERAKMPKETLKELEEIGISAPDSTYKGDGTEHRLIQLLCRGDRRLQDMLIEMAKAGFFRHGRFGKEAAEFADRWISSHDVPGYDVWFEEKPKTAVFPWDFIDNGVSKEHLWKRYCSAVSTSPKDFSRCLEQCQNCGACSEEGQRRMSSYRKERKKDNQIPLSDLISEPEKKKESLFYVILKFTFEDQYSVVLRRYWEEELSRALLSAGIDFERALVSIEVPYQEQSDWAAGMNCAVIALKEDIPDDELIRRLNRHTLHMKICRVIRTETAPRMISASYSIPCPELDLKETERIRKKIRTILDSDEWIIEKKQGQDMMTRTIEENARDRILALFLEDRCVKMKLDYYASPYSVYEALLEVSWEEAGRYRAVRTAMEYESNGSVLCIE